MSFSEWYETQEVKHVTQIRLRSDRHQHLMRAPFEEFLAVVLQQFDYLLDVLQMFPNRIFRSLGAWANPLCFKYLVFETPRRHCQACPVFRMTRTPYCLGTPYLAWLQHPSRHAYHEQVLAVRSFFERACLSHAYVRYPTKAIADQLRQNS